MRKRRGFVIGKKLICFTKWVFRRHRCPTRYSRLTRPDPEPKSKAIKKIIEWGKGLKSGARSICSVKGGYKAFGVEAGSVPKGHLAVYVGQKDGEYQRVLVPVFYFNNPLFGELLKEAEEEYGFHQQGGITIPCPFSHFQRVHSRIKTASASRSFIWKRTQYY